MQIIQYFNKDPATLKATKQKQYSEEQSELPSSANVYEQVHLSKLSSSTDVIPSAESEAISNVPWEPQTNFHGIYLHIDTDMPNSATQETEMNILNDPTYDVVGKENNKELVMMVHQFLPVVKIIEHSITKQVI